MAPFALVLASILGIACASHSQERRPDIPVLDGAAEVTSGQGENGPYQIQFMYDVAFPSSRVRDFYASWAEQNGWIKVSAEEEDWSLDRWSSFEVFAGGSVDMWPVHWYSPGKVWSLRLTLLHRNDRSRQEVLLMLSPFHLLQPSEDGETLGDYLPNG